MKHPQSSLGLTDTGNGIRLRHRICKVLLLYYMLYGGSAAGTLEQSESDDVTAGSSSDVRIILYSTLLG